MMMHSVVDREEAAEGHLQQNSIAQQSNQKALYHI